MVQAQADAGLASLDQRLTSNVGSLVKLCFRVPCAMRPHMLALVAILALTAPFVNAQQGERIVPMRKTPGRLPVCTRYPTLLFSVPVGSCDHHNAVARSCCVLGTQLAASRATRSPARLAAPRTPAVMPPVTATACSR